MPLETLAAVATDAAAPLSAAQRNQRMLDRYVDGETLAAIGDDYGVTRERVRQIVTQLGGSLAEESRQSRSEARLLARSRQVDDFMAEFGETSRRIAHAGNTREDTIRRLCHANPGLDILLAEEALRQSDIVFDHHGDDIFSTAAIEAGVWYLLGSDLGLAPDRAHAAEAIDLGLMEELRAILLAGDATEEDVATVLGVIGAAQKHAGEHPDASITGARYNELRQDLVNTLGWVSAKGSSPWPPTRQTLTRRHKYWNVALAAMGLATAGRGRTPGLVKFTDEQYASAMEFFVATQKAAGCSATYAAYEDLARDLAETEAPIPSGSSMRNYFGGWAEALRTAGGTPETEKGN